MTAQSAVYFLEPTLGTMPAKLWDITGLDSVENRFKWTNVYNSWVSYAPNDQYANWVVNFPTKGYHVDQNCANVQAGNNAWRNNGVNVLNCRGDNSALYVATAGGNASGQRVTPPEAQVAPFSNLWNLAAVNTATDNPDRDNANSLVTAQAYVYDREEGMGTEGPIFSPAPNNPFVLPYETNVINFVTGDPDPLQSTIGSFLDVQTALDNPDAQYGWVNLQLNSSGGDALYQYRGLPSYGVMLQMRRASSATYFTGDMTNHGYSYQLK
ncbi:hypothetical protein CCR91_21225 [Thiorhodovibrio winogradskyi]|nr:hypothetical protein [Thiorhodovibrio winogradskyi]